MLKQIEEWIRQVNQSHAPQRQSCSRFEEPFSGFYSPGFLNSAYFVVVDQIPKPDLPGLRAAGLGDFIDMDVAGITYDDTYYVQRSVANELRLHFHELVHVVQWRQLQPLGFITRYLDEIQAHGYNDAPLEKMAYRLDGHYQANGKSLDVEDYVRTNL